LKETISAKTTIAKGQKSEKILKKSLEIKIRYGT